jgi:hypothetical protein
MYNAGGRRTVVEGSSARPSFRSQYDTVALEVPMTAPNWRVVKPWLASVPKASTSVSTNFLCGAIFVRRSLEQQKLATKEMSFFENRDIFLILKQSCYNTAAQATSTRHVARTFWGIFGTRGQHYGKN